MPSSGPNRKFCLLLAAACAVIGVMAHRAGHQGREILWGAGAVLFLFVALVVPRIADPARRAWMALGHRLSFVVNPVVLGIVYAGVLTPIALTRRLLGHESLSTTLRYSSLVGADLRRAHRMAGAIERLGVD